MLLPYVMRLINYKIPLGKLLAVFYGKILHKTISGNIVLKSSASCVKI